MTPPPMPTVREVEAETDPEVLYAWAMLCDEEDGPTHCAYCLAWERYIALTAITTGRAPVLDWLIAHGHITPEQADQAIVCTMPQDAG